MKLDPVAKYQDSHEWARPEDEHTFVTGISDHAQDSLSDVVYVELPEIGATLSRGEVFGVVESVKAASDLYMPMDGEIIDVNTALEDEPELVNSDPYGAGWMIKFKATSPEQWNDLLTGGEYEEVAESDT